MPVLVCVCSCVLNLTLVRVPVAYVPHAPRWQGVGDQSGLENRAWHRCVMILLCVVLLCCCAESAFVQKPQRRTALKMATHKRHKSSSSRQCKDKDKDKNKASRTASTNLTFPRQTLLWVRSQHTAQQQPQVQAQQRQQTRP